MTIERRGVCFRCGRGVALRTDGSVGSHHCPHGHLCVKARRPRKRARGRAERWRDEPCTDCREARQLTLKGVA